MSSELLDFCSQNDFQFKMTSFAGHGEKEKLQADCGRVVDLAKATVKDMCLLAVQLYEIKEKGIWENVINPETGLGFYNYKFDDFCAYAFGFSKTKTSNLLRISQFVEMYGDNAGEIQSSYADYNTSQLVELAAVAPSNRVYFSSDMTVAEMRAAKDYIKMGTFFEDKKRVGFDLVTETNRWKEKKQQEKSNPDVLPGQTSLEGLEEVYEEEREDDSTDLSNPTSDLAEVGEAEKERVIKRALTYSEALAVRIYRKYKENPLHSELVDYIKYAYGNGGSWNGDIDLSYNSKGLTITKRTGNFKEVFTLFLSWAQVTQRIVTLINNDEYLSHTVKFAIDEQLKKAQVNEPKDEYEPAEDEVWQGGGLDRDSDDYDEADEAQEDMQAEMQTIEAEAERSVFAAEKSDVGFGESLQEQKEYDPYVLMKGQAPFFKPTLENRKGIREFYNGFRNWEQIYLGIESDFMQLYRYKTDIGTLYALSNKKANIMQEQSEREYTNSVRYFWKDKGGEIFETSIFDLEKFIPLHKDELQRRY